MVLSNGAEGFLQNIQIFTPSQTYKSGFYNPRSGFPSKIRPAAASHPHRSALYPPAYTGLSGQTPADAPGGCGHWPGPVPVPRSLKPPTGLSRPRPSNHGSGFPDRTRSDSNPRRGSDRYICDREPPVQNVTLIGVFCCHTYVAVIHA